MENFMIEKTARRETYHVVATAADGTRMIVAAYATEKSAVMLLAGLQESADHRRSGRYLETKGAVANPTRTGNG
jgi:hypothetical protein